MVDLRKKRGAMTLSPSLPQNGSVDTANLGEEIYHEQIMYFTVLLR